MEGAAAAPAVITVTANSQGQVLRRSMICNSHRFKSEARSESAFPPHILTGANGKFLSAGKDSAQAASPGHGNSLARWL